MASRARGAKASRPGFFATIACLVLVLTVLPFAVLSYAALRTGHHVAVPAPA
eukprot:CAMPEP_0203919134 /NCGR_PEP_ID=MMETSP0359-20131031/59601_1 /ASSEMBLY_ACC=CAM_ASM_000338 /TAXON_ID=268821 /ORGANISM="Scrippsiella Hangoei, Strain SHTV-5" /LENGTH=51 /DNA_ID=CAMNT_0050846357 /DNA_START=13 /DNA_END=165 /DNA_ORIENTATION=+